jgi:hypothetical protein
MATYNSSSITRGDPGRLGVYGTTSIGEIALASTVTLTNGDILPICQIPNNSFIKSLILNIPIINPSGTTLTMSLEDTLASPTVYITNSASGSNFSAATTLTTANFSNTTMGTMYGATARSIGSTGCPVVVWAATSWNSSANPGVGLILKVTATATAAVGSAQYISYIVEFAPNYDAGS